MKRVPGVTVTPLVHIYSSLRRLADVLSGTLAKSKTRMRPTICNFISLSAA